MNRLRSCDRIGVRPCIGHRHWGDVRGSTASGGVGVVMETAGKRVLTCGQRRRVVLLRQSTCHRTMIVAVIAVVHFDLFEGKDFDLLLRRLGCGNVVRCSGSTNVMVQFVPQLRNFFRLLGNDRFLCAARTIGETAKFAVRLTRRFRPPSRRFVQQTIQGHQRIVVVQVVVGIVIVG